MPTANITFHHLHWNESTVHEQPEGTKLTRAEVGIAYRGDLEGESHVEYVMSYQADGTADFVGMERVTGRIGGKQGSFVLRHEGRYEKEKAHAILTVLAGSATGELEGLTGSATFSAGHAKEYPLELEYELPG